MPHSAHAPLRLSSAAANPSRGEGVRCTEEWDLDLFDGIDLTSCLGIFSDREKFTHQHGCCDENSRSVNLYGDSTIPDSDASNRRCASGLLGDLSERIRDWGALAGPLC